MTGLAKVAELDRETQLRLSYALAVFEDHRRTDERLLAVDELVARIQQLVTEESVARAGKACRILADDQNVLSPEEAAQILDSQPMIGPGTRAKLRRIAEAAA